MTRALTVFFVLVSIGLASFLVYSIWDDIEQEKRIARSEAAVIRKLEMIRKAEIAFLGVENRYTASWDTLIAFIDTGKVYNIQKREEIITLAYGADSVITHYDTLGFAFAKDTLFPAKDYPKFNLERLPYIPLTNNKKFSIDAGKITKGGVKVDVIEVVDVAPLNPKRREAKTLRNQKPLRFGSMTDVTTSGNWE